MNKLEANIIPLNFLQITQANCHGTHPQNQQNISDQEEAKKTTFEHYSPVLHIFG